MKNETETTFQQQNSVYGPNEKLIIEAVGESTNEFGAAPVPPSAPSTVMKSKISPSWKLFDGNKYKHDTYSITITKKI